MLFTAFILFIGSYIELIIADIKIINLKLSLLGENNGYVDIIYSVLVEIKMIGLKLCLLNDNNCCCDIIDSILCGTNYC